MVKIIISHFFTSVRRFCSKMRPRYRRISHSSKQNHKISFFRLVTHFYSIMASPIQQKGNRNHFFWSWSLHVEPRWLGRSAERVGRARPARAGPRPGPKVRNFRKVFCLSLGIETFLSNFHFSLYLNYFTASMQRGSKFCAKWRV